MLSVGTIATITVAAHKIFPLEASPGDVYGRDGEELALAEVAREDPVAVRTIEEGASAPNNDRPPVLSPDKQLQVLEGFVGGYHIQLHSLGRAPDVPNLFVSDGSVMNTEAAANAALTAVAPARPHRGVAESGTVSPATDLGAGPTVFLCLTEETVMLASSTIRWR